jgi:hypothetical protein
MSIETLEPTLAEQPPAEQAAPLVVVVPETDADVENRRQAKRFIGRVAINEGDSAAHETLAVKPIESLYQAIHEAADGKPEARKMVETNVRTDVIERTMKSGHVMKVDLMEDEAGNIQQHGQSMESVQANSLKFAATSWQMKERVEAETTNLFRIKHQYERGILEDYCFVVFSRAADNMSEEAMDEAGFFTETMTCAIQVTTAEKGKLTTESAFVAGVKKPGEGRHDKETLRGVVNELGVELSDETATGTVGTPFLIHKSKLKNGVIDLVQLWDKHVPKDHQDEEIFFGEAKPRQDYLEHLKVCRDREERFEPKVQKITNRLIQVKNTIKTKVAAVKRLHEISGSEMIEQALGDSDIDPRVFGPVAAAEIYEARLALDQGRYEEVIAHINVAKANDRSSSCPGAGTGGEESKENNHQSSSETCTYTSKECPMCGAKNVKTTVTATHIKGKCGCVVRKKS